MQPGSILLMFCRTLVVRIAALAVVYHALTDMGRAQGDPVWVVPLGGNAYLTSPAEGSNDRVEAAGIRLWRSEKSVFSIYFRVDRPTGLDLSLRMRIPEGESVLRASVGNSTFEITQAATPTRDLPLGRVSTEAAGYVRVDLQGVRKSGLIFAEVESLIVRPTGSTPNLDYVKESAGNRFYWGRRGPSVHLSYQPPAGKTVEFFHSELTVPEGQDPIGSYFMANGFSEGYFGMQVKGQDERWILFSVWSPFHTDDPTHIPQDHMVKLLAKGAGVRIGQFGNEGAGAQSILIYPWKAGITYRFLNRARPDGRGNTLYTAWFFPPEEGKWKLIASFSRPKTNTHLTGIHSFLENFADRNGHLGRSARFSNQWARDTHGDWHEITRARFTGDDIAMRRYRLDFAGGTQSDIFFLRNGGFFKDPVGLGIWCERKASPAKLPKIDFTALGAAE